VHSKKKIVETANLAKRKYPTRPGIIEIQSFRDHLQTTGRPDTWHGHELSKPPPGGDLEELIAFSIPTYLRSAVGKATCPICSPNAPKYYDGVLVWSEKEGVIRAIGDDCAKNHYGFDIAVRARNDRLHKEKTQSIEYFLIDFLQKVGELRCAVQQLTAIARDIDSVRRTFGLRLGKIKCQNLVKMEHSGKLVVERVLNTTQQDRFGNLISVRTTEVIQEYRVHGLAFLSQRIGVEAIAENTKAALDLLHSGSEDEVLSFVAGMHGNLSHLQDAETLALNAKESYEKLLNLVDDARSFFEPNNLENLTKWSNNRNSQSPVTITYEREKPHQVRVWTSGMEAVAIPIPVKLRG